MARTQRVAKKKSGHYVMSASKLVEEERPEARPVARNSRIISVDEIKREHHIDEDEHSSEQRPSSHAAINAFREALRSQESIPEYLIEEEQKRRQDPEYLERIRKQAVIAAEQNAREDAEHKQRDANIHRRWEEGQERKRQELLAERAAWERQQERRREQERRNKLVRKVIAIIGGIVLLIMLVTLILMHS